MRTSPASAPGWCALPAPRKAPALALRLRASRRSETLLPDLTDPHHSSSVNIQPCCPVHVGVLTVQHIDWGPYNTESLADPSDAADAHSFGARSDTLRLEVRGAWSHWRCRAGGVAHASRICLLGVCQAQHGSCGPGWPGTTAEPPRPFRKRAVTHGQFLCRRAVLPTGPAPTWPCFQSRRPSAECRI